ncbi:Non-canonical poly(A) RNA polymerase papd5 [Tyrophagus putrescentiae]|nr:Non-canonical poly(A) RNA polymerase papd5 [Tyrophagus putrescentiae]
MSQYLHPKKCYYENLRCPSCIMTNAAQICRYQGMPWVSYNNGSYQTDYDSVYEGLSAELEDFYQFIRPKAEDDALRKATFLCIAKSIKASKKFDIEAVRYYGSFSSNTYLPVSDIDMVVIVPKENNVVAVLFEVAYLLFIDGIIEKHCSIIPHSRIPLLKFYDCMTGFQINITINTPNVMERAEYIRQSFFPKGIRGSKASAQAGGGGGGGQYELKILYFMKYYLLYRNSNQVYFGGIGSYALSLMVLRYFQEKETVELISRAANGTAATAATAAAERSSTHTADDGDEGEGEVEGDDVGSSSSSSGGIGQSSLLGRLLIGFLQRYSDVDFISKVTISVRDGGAYRPSPPVVASQPHYQLHHHHQQQQQLMNMSGGSSTFSSDGSSSAAADVLPQQQVGGNIGGGGVKHPASHFAGHYLNKKCSVLRIEDPREPWKNVSAGSFNSDLILADFGRLLQALLHPKEAGGGLHGLYEDGQNQWSIIANGLTVVDSFVEYRTILKDIYRFWFPTVPKQSPSQSSPRPVNELYESFIQQRNIFGPRHIERKVI